VEETASWTVKRGGNAMRTTPPITIGDDEDDFWGPEYH